MHGNGLSHSVGESRPITNSDIVTRKKHANKHPQTPPEKGCKKENSSGSSFLGFSKRIEMPRFMKGIVKSIAD